MRIRFVKNKMEAAMTKLTRMIVPCSKHKPHKGRIAHMIKVQVCEPDHEHLGYYYRCLFRDHPSFAGRFGHTSLVVAEDGYEIETLNSRYTYCAI